MSTVSTVSGYFWKEKNSITFSLYAFTAEQGWILAKIGKCCKYLTVISNDPGFKIIYFEFSYYGDISFKRSYLHEFFPV